MLVERIDPAIFEERKKQQHKKKSLKQALQRLQQLFYELALGDQNPRAQPKF